MSLMAYDPDRDPMNPANETIRALQAQLMTKQPETGWLVENDNGGPCWWGRTPDGEAAFGWTKNSLMALRFARKEDAEAYIEEIGWTDVVATEHQWGP